MKNGWLYPMNYGYPMIFSENSCDIPALFPALSPLLDSSNPKKISQKIHDLSLFLMSIPWNSSFFGYHQRSPCPKIWANPIPDMNPLRSWILRIILPGAEKLQRIFGWEIPMDPPYGDSYGKYGWKWREFMIFMDENVLRRCANIWNWMENMVINTTHSWHWPWDHWDLRYRHGLKWGLRQNGLSWRSWKQLTGMMVVAPILGKLHIFKIGGAENGDSKVM